MSSERYRAATVAGGAIGVLGSVLPWVAAGVFELDVNSVYALVASALVVVVAVGYWTSRSRYVVGALAGVVAALALEAITNFASSGPPSVVPAVDTGPGIGAYVALLGGALALAGVALDVLAD
ncbi:hypothetical protein G9C85_18005 [Halorubellus sp. JP-L1]|uniref:hypothetical protein n=1 Tax=Halorubellus sp. JP-L1 TaxID=2715753 RepID=UPI001409639A|nr:hypothetical protein [Halorubellus sp. JP-L1]NHN43516.1 hypothetical protein [Halorubellus sp. JP-L1]